MFAEASSSEPQILNVNHALLNLNLRYLAPAYGWALLPILSGVAGCGNLRLLKDPCDSNCGILKLCDNPIESASVLVLVHDAIDDREFTVHSSRLIPLPWNRCGIICPSSCERATCPKLLKRRPPKSQNSAVQTESLSSISMNTQKETVLRTAAQEARALLFLSKAQSKVLENKHRAKEPFPYQGAPFP
jgi:hypothetical protein